MRNKRELRANRKQRCCEDCATVHIKAEVLTNEVSRTVYDGRDTIIVPVIMAKSSIPMNGFLFPAEEMFPAAWNGVPVTIGHPQEGDGFISANATPDILAKWSVGRIFEAVIDGDALKAQAYIDIGKIENLAPGLLEALETGAPIDVSTGLFSDSVERPGKVGDREYEEVYSNVVPDHLAILIEEEGACSFADGCGVRANKAEQVLRAMQDEFQTFMEAIRMKLKLNKDNGSNKSKANEDPKSKKANEDSKSKKANERGDETDPRQMIADLISSEESPFLPDDEESLRMMSPETLGRVAAKFGLGPSAAEEDPEPTEDPDENENEDEDDKKKSNSKKAKEVKKGDTDVMANLSKEDKEALAHARKSYQAHRSSLVSKIVANSDLKKEQLEEMDTATLETFAAGIRPVANYGGRAFANADDGDDETREMVPSGIVAHSQKVRKEREGKAN